MKTGKLDIKGNTLGLFHSSEIKDFTLNISLNAFRLAHQASMTVFNMVKGFGDDFVDQSGIDLSNSNNYFYHSGSYFYEPSFTGGGIDGLTKLMLHFDNNIFDAADGKNVSLINTTFSNTVSKFGGYSIELNGSTSNIAVDDSNDFYWGTSDFTVDFWVYMIDIPIPPPFFGQFQDEQHLQYFYWWVDGRIYFFSSINAYVGGFQFSCASTLVTGAWNHVALVREGVTNWYIFINGISQPLTLDTTFPGGYDFSLPNFSAPFEIMSGPGQQNALHGYVDEFRVSKGIARWTSDFAVPTSAYSFAYADNMKLVSLQKPALTVPTQARLVLFEEDIDVITLNTDLNAYVSRDNGITFTKVILNIESNSLTSDNILSGLVDLSSQPSGTQMVYKIETANGKHLRLYGISLTWN